MYILYIFEELMTRISASDLRPRLAGALRSAEARQSVLITVTAGRPRR